MDRKDDSGSSRKPDMRLVDKTPKKPHVTRRAFLKGSGIASVGISVIPASALLTSANEAFAQSFKSLGPGAAKDLLRMARDIFPHDKLAEKYYMQAIQPYEDAAAKDAATRKLFVDGLANLNATAKKMHGKAYAAIPEEEKRVEVLKAIESTPFFQKVKGGLVTGLYDNKAVYSFFGYEGSSWEKGGYINRGFNDIDWL